MIVTSPLLLREQLLADAASFPATAACLSLSTGARQHNQASIATRSFFFGGPSARAPTVVCGKTSKGITTARALSLPPKMRYTPVSTNCSASTCISPSLPLLDVPAADAISAEFHASTAVLAVATPSRASTASSFSFSSASSVPSSSFPGVLAAPVAAAASVAVSVALSTANAHHDFCCATTETRRDAAVTNGGFSMCSYFLPQKQHEQHATANLCCTFSEQLQQQQMYTSSQLYVPTHAAGAIPEGHLQQQERRQEEKKQQQPQQQLQAQQQQQQEVHHQQQRKKQQQQAQQPIQAPQQQVQQQYEQQQSEKQQQQPQQPVQIPEVPTQEHYEGQQRKKQQPQQRQQQQEVPQQQQREKQQQQPQQSVKTQQQQQQEARQQQQKRKQPQQPVQTPQQQTQQQHEEQHRKNQQHQLQLPVRTQQQQQQEAAQQQQQERRQEQHIQRHRGNKRSTRQGRQQGEQQKFCLREPLPQQRHEHGDSVHSLRQSVIFQQMQQEQRTYSRQENQHIEQQQLWNGLLQHPQSPEQQRQQLQHQQQQHQQQQHEQQQHQQQQPQQQQHQHRQEEQHQQHQQHQRQQQQQHHQHQQHRRYGQHDPQHHQQQHVEGFSMITPPPLTPVARSVNETAAVLCSYSPRVLTTLAQQLLIFSHALALLLIAQDLSPLPMSPYIVDLYLQQQKMFTHATSSNMNIVRDSPQENLLLRSSKLNPRHSASANNKSISNEQKQQRLLTPSFSSAASLFSMAAAPPVKADIQKSYTDTTAALAAISNPTLSSLFSSSPPHDQEVFPKAGSSYVNTLSLSSPSAKQHIQTSITEPSSSVLSNPSSTTFSSPSASSPSASLSSSPPRSSSSSAYSSSPLPSSSTSPSSSISSSPSSFSFSSSHSSLSSPPSSDGDVVFFSSRAAAELQVLLSQLAAVARVLFLGVAGCCFLLLSTPIFSFPYIRVCMQRAHNRVLLSPCPVLLSPSPSLLTEVFPDIVFACLGGILLSPCLLHVEQYLCSYLAEVLSLFYLPFFFSSSPSFFLSSPICSAMSLPVAAFLTAARDVYATHIYFPTHFSSPFALSLSSLLPTSSAITSSSSTTTLSVSAAAAPSPTVTHIPTSSAHHLLSSIIAAGAGTTAASSSSPPSISSSTSPSSPSSASSSHKQHLREPDKIYKGDTQPITRVSSVAAAMSRRLAVAVAGISSDSLSASPSRQAVMRRRNTTAQSHPSSFSSASTNVTSAAAPLPDAVPAMNNAVIHRSLAAVLPPAHPPPRKSPSQNNSGVRTPARKHFSKGYTRSDTTLFTSSSLAGNCSNTGRTSSAVHMSNSSIAPASVLPTPASHAGAAVAAASPADLVPSAGSLPAGAASSSSASSSSLAGASRDSPSLAAASVASSSADVSHVATPSLTAMMTALTSSSPYSPNISTAPDSHTDAAPCISSSSVDNTAASPPPTAHSAPAFLSRAPANVAAATSPSTDATSSVRSPVDGSPATRFLLALASSTAAASPDNVVASSSSSDAAYAAIDSSSNTPYAAAASSSLDAVYPATGSSSSDTYYPADASSSSTSASTASSLVASSAFSSSSSPVVASADSSFSFPPGVAVGTNSTTASPCASANTATVGTFSSVPPRAENFSVFTSFSPVGRWIAILVGISACGCIYGLFIPTFSSSIISSTSFSSLAFSFSLFLKPPLGVSVPEEASVYGSHTWLAAAPPASHPLRSEKTAGPQGHIADTGDTATRRGEITGTGDATGLGCASGRQDTERNENLADVENAPGKAEATALTNTVRTGDATGRKKRRNVSEIGAAAALSHAAGRRDTAGRGGAAGITVTTGLGGKAEETASLRDEAEIRETAKTGDATAVSHPVGRKETAERTETAGIGETGDIRSAPVLLLWFMPFSFLPCLAFGAALCCCFSFRHYKKYCRILCWQERCSCCLRTWFLFCIACSCAAGSVQLSLRTFSVTSISSSVAPRVIPPAGFSSIRQFSLLYVWSVCMPSAALLVRVAALLLLLIPLLQLLLLYYSVRLGTVRARLQHAFCASFSPSPLLPGSNTAQPDDALHGIRRYCSRSRRSSRGYKRSCSGNKSDRSDPSNSRNRSRRCILLEDIGSGNERPHERTTLHADELRSDLYSYQSQSNHTHSLHAPDVTLMRKSGATSIPNASSGSTAGFIKERYSVTPGIFNAVCPSAAREVSLVLLPASTQVELIEDAGHASSTALHYQLAGEDPPETSAPLVSAPETFKPFVYTDTRTPRLTQSRWKNILPRWLLSSETERDWFARRDPLNGRSSRMATLMLTRAPADTHDDAINPFST